MANAKTKVFMYCRKSQEDKDRQVLSIEAQEDELWKVAKNLNLEVVGEPIEEEMSAKAPGRPKFGKLLERLHAGEASGVLCWKLDRLARNPIDGGAVIWQVKDQGKVIYTPSQIYSHAQENTILMYFEFGMAQKYIDDLGKNTKRGMIKKASMGWYPAPAPTGYLNYRKKRDALSTIIADEENLPLVKKAFQEVLAGKQVSEVWKAASEVWKLKSPQGKIISRSGFYRMLTNPFYYGEFEWPLHSDTWYKGNHTPAITQEEFDLVQKVLGIHGRPITRNHVHELTGLFRCAHCHSAITATKKTKHYKGTDRTVVYTYYHCSRKNREIPCHEAPMTEKELFAQVYQQLILLRPPEEFVEWAKKWISFMHGQESDTQEKILESQNAELVSIEKKLNNLLNMRISEEIDEATYANKKKSFERDRDKLKDLIEKTSSGMSDWRIRVEKAVDVAFGSYIRFKTGERDIRHEILFNIGSNLRVDNQKMRVDLSDHFQECAENANWDKKYKLWIEPQKYTDMFAKRPDLRPANPSWLRDRDSNPDIRLQRALSYH